jgi:hypothetical protein
VNLPHRCGGTGEPSTSQVARRCHNKKRPATGPALIRVAGGGSHHPAGKAELALTWRTMALVVAPQEHPFEIGLGSKREAGHGAQRTCRHATPVTEALHVPLHREVELGCSRAATRQHLAPGDLARRFLSQWLCLAVSSGSGWVRDWCAGHSIREFLTAVPSMSASPSVILVCVQSRMSSLRRFRLVSTRVSASLRL